MNNKIILLAICYHRHHGTCSLNVSIRPLLAMALVLERLTRERRLLIEDWI